MRSAMVVVLAWALLAELGAGGSRTKEDLIEKSRNVTTRAELERALGQPSDIGKLGPVEQWTYKASNGTVVLLIVDQVTLQATGGTPAEAKDMR